MMASDASNDTNSKENSSRPASIFSKTDDDDNDDSVHILDQRIHEEVMMIGNEKEIAAYREACKVSPVLVATETAAYQFYRQQDVKRSAKALATYWKIRKEVFGRDEAFRPVSQMVTRGGQEAGLSAWPLACDEAGHPVVWIQAPHRQQSSRTLDWIEFSKTLFRVFAHVAASSPEEATKLGVVVLFSMYCSNTTELDTAQSLARTVLNLIRDALPIKLAKFHVLCSTLDADGNDAFFYSFVPSVMPYCLELGRYDTCELHVRMGADFLDRLEPFGLSGDDLPMCLGGNLSFEGSCGNTIRCDPDTRVLSTHGNLDQTRSNGSDSAMLDIISITARDVNAGFISGMPWYHKSNKFPHDCANAQVRSQEWECRTNEFYRKRNAMYARRKYMRKKIEIDVLGRQCTALRIDNKKLEKDHSRLNELLASAKQTVAVFKRTLTSNSNPRRERCKYGARTNQLDQLLSKRSSLASATAMAAVGQLLQIPADKMLMPSQDGKRWPR